VQDDRAWGDQRYALRLRFSPGSGNIQESALEFEVKLKAAPAK